MAIEPLTEPAPADEHDTEPMAAVKVVSPELCGICGNAAEPLTYCMRCHSPLCGKCKLVVIDGSGRVTCPAHKGGE